MQVLKRVWPSRLPLSLPVLSCGIAPIVPSCSSVICHRALTRPSRRRHPLLDLSNSELHHSLLCIQHPASESWIQPQKMTCDRAALGQGPVLLELVVWVSSRGPGAQEGLGEHLATPGMCAAQTSQPWVLREGGDPGQPFQGAHVESKLRQTQCLEESGWCRRLETLLGYPLCRRSLRRHQHAVTQHLQRCHQQRPGHRFQGRRLLLAHCNLGLECLFGTSSWDLQ